MAFERSIPPGHISLMVAAYIPGRTTRHRGAHSSLLDKAADFPIDDAPAILERLCPSQVKSAAASERESGIHVGYSLSPSWYTRTTHESRMEKAAAATDWKLTDRPVLITKHNHFYLCESFVSLATFCSRNKPAPASSVVAPFSDSVGTDARPEKRLVVAAESRSAGSST